MGKSERAEAIRHRLFEHFRNSSNTHMRNALTISVLADELAEIVKPDRTLWVKWTEDREQLVKAGRLCWIPLEDFVTCLNAMPGPPLTRTDVAQRLRAFHDESFDSPNALLKDGCLEIFAREQAAGTEMIAIIGAIQDHVEEEEARLWRERDAQWRQQREEDRKAREQRLVSGADCPWTPHGGAKALFCRINGRLYRSSATPDKRRRVERLASLDDEDGPVVGVYRGQTEATAAVKTAAFSTDLI